jgi:RNA polymerase sigma-70 factor (ECF subfamily)
MGRLDERGYAGCLLALAQPDRAVLLKARRGDQQAFASIVRLYETAVYNYVLRLTSGDRALAEDLTQEVFLKVFRGLPRFQAQCKFTSWLFQVAKHRVLDELRARERRPLSVVNLDELAPLVAVERPAERGEEIEALWQAIEALNVDLKPALLLRDLVGLSYSEIAEALEVTLATVKWRIYKAREEVQAALVEQGVTFGMSAPDIITAA